MVHIGFYAAAVRLDVPIHGAVDSEKIGKKDALKFCFHLDYFIYVKLPNLALI
jgi:hypothetical protein